MSEHWVFVGVGYGIAWLAMVGYILRLRARERAAGIPDRGRTAGKGSASIPDEDSN